MDFQVDEKNTVVLKPCHKSELLFDVLLFNIQSFANEIVVGVQERKSTYFLFYSLKSDGFYETKKYFVQKQKCEGIHSIAFSQQGYFVISFHSSTLLQRYQIFSGDGMPICPSFQIKIKCQKTVRGFLYSNEVALSFQENDLISITYQLAHSVWYYTYTLDGVLLTKSKVFTFKPHPQGCSDLVVSNNEKGPCLTECAFRAFPVLGRGQIALQSTSLLTASVRRFQKIIAFPPRSHVKCVSIIEQDGNFYVCFSFAKKRRVFGFRVYHYKESDSAYQKSYFLPCDCLNKKKPGFTLVVSKDCQNLFVLYGWYIFCYPLCMT